MIRNGCAVMLVALGLAGAVLPSAVFARVPAAVLEEAMTQMEMSLDFSGHLDVDVQGRVTAVAIDKQDKYPPAMVEFVRNQVSGWEFERELRDGVAVPFRTPMQLQLLGRKQDDDSYTVRVASTTFRAPLAQDRVAQRRMAPPRFPRAVFEKGLEGVVYLLLQVDADGRVANVIAEQVNMYRIGLPRDMERARTQLAAVSVDAARRWSFDVPAPAIGGGRGRCSSGFQSASPSARRWTAWGAGNRTCPVSVSWPPGHWMAVVASALRPWRPVFTVSATRRPGCSRHWKGELTLRSHNKKPRDAGLFVVSLQRWFSASSRRRTRRWTWWSSSCRA